MGDVVGSAEFELRASRKKMADDLRDAKRDLQVGVNDMEKTALEGGDRIGSGLSRMAKGTALAFTALTAVMTFAFAAAIQVGRASLEMADNLANSAKRIGIGTEALQEWQYVARKTGEDATAVSGALETFATKFEQAAAGLSKESLDAFKALGFSQEDLRGFKDVETALDATTDRIGELSRESDRAAISEKLGLGPLTTALQDGSDEVARLRDEAAALGFVMDDALIQKGAAAQGQLEDLSQIISIQLAGAFIDLSDEVIAFTGHIADALRGLNDFLGRAREWQRNTDAMYGQGFTAKLQEGGAVNLGSALFQGVGNLVSGRTGRAAAQIRNGDSIAGPVPSLAQMESFANGGAGDRPNREVTPSGRTSLTPVQPRGPADNSADKARRAAEQEARRAERVEQEIFRARQQYLGIAEGDLLTAQQRFDLAQDRLSLDRDARDAEIDSKAKRGEYTASEAEALKSQNRLNDGLEDRILADNAFREIDDERLAKEKLLSGLASDLLSLQSGGARTAAERRKIEEDLLKIIQAERRAALNRQLDLEKADAATRAQALGTLGSIETAENTAVGRNNMSPLEAWRDQSLKTAGEINEAYENVAASGLDALNQGLVDAIMNSKELGDVFSNVARQILADLLSISVRRGITEPLANALFPSGSTSVTAGGSNILSGIGSAVSSFFGGFGRRAGGGPVSAGQGYIVGEHRPELFVPSMSGTIVPNLGGATGSGQPQVQRVIVTTNDDRFNAYVDDRAAPVGAAAFSASRQAVPSDMAKTNRYTRGRPR